MSYCKQGNKWERIGYIVKEALDSLHEAIEANNIISVKFEWIRYITYWSSSGSGWYCGINIARKGLWLKEVVRCKSTI